MTPAQKALEECRKSMRLLASGEFCLFGCKIMKQEGTRSYTENSPITRKGICTKCGKKRYGFLTEEEKIIKDIIE